MVDSAVSVILTQKLTSSSVSDVCAAHSAATPVCPISQLRINKLFSLRLSICGSMSIKQL